jgi:hypothetical protein
MDFIRHNLLSAIGLFLSPLVVVGDLIVSALHLFEMGLPAGIWAAIGVVIFALSVIGVLYRQHLDMRELMASRGAASQDGKPETPPASIRPAHITPIPRAYWIATVVMAGIIAAATWISVYWAPQKTIGKATVATESEQYSGSPLGIRWPSARLVIVTPPVIYSIDVDAKSVGTEEITLKDAYVISGIDGSKVDMHVSTPPLPWISPQEAAPVPPNTYLAFRALFNNITEPDFFKNWENFSIVIQYNNSTLRHEFNRQWVIDQINQSHPESQPHVSRGQP